MWKPIFDGYNFINFISLRDLDSLKLFIYPFKDFWGIAKLRGWFGKVFWGKFMDFKYWISFKIET